MNFQPLFWAGCLVGAFATALVFATLTLITGVPCE